MYPRIIGRRAAIAALALLAGPALAADPLTLGEALRRATVAHPDLQGFAPQQAAADAGQALAGRAPAPEIGLLLEDAFGSGQRRALDDAQWTLSYSQALELGGQRAGRQAVAAAQSGALQARQQEQRGAALAEVTQRFIEAAADAERLHLAERQVTQAQQALDAADARVRAAAAPLAERSRARAALAQAVLQREHAEHEEKSARVALAVAMGLHEPDFGLLQAELYRLPPLRPLDELRAALQASPAAQARLAQTAVHEAERRAALASAGARPTLTGGLRRYEQGDDVGLVLGLALPLGMQRRARDEADIAGARVVEGEAGQRGALLRAEELLFERYQELGHAREALQLIETEVLPSLDEALQQTQYAYQRGRYGYLEVAQALRERNDAARERIDTAARFHSLVAEVEQLTGESLVARSTP